MRFIHNLVMIDRMRVFQTCPLVVTCLAKGLEVVLVPEWCRVTTVRNDVVYYGRLHVTSLGKALDAQRMLAEISGSNPTPPRVVAKLCRRGSFRMQRFVLVAVALTGID